MRVETCEKCRRTRLTLMSLLIVFASLAGYHWGVIIDNYGAGVREHDVLVLGIAFAVLSVLTALWVEAIVTRTEMEAAKAHAAEEEKAEEAVHNDEHARELDRIVAKLSEDNKELKYRLLSSKVHDVGDDMVRDLRGDGPMILSKAS